LAESETSLGIRSKANLMMATAKLSVADNTGQGVTSVRQGLPVAEDLPPEEVIFGSCHAMEQVHRSVERAASADIPWLLQGETGTGKEVLARLLHRRSRWGRGSFVKVNCPAIPGALIESELFGYERGAFTGALETKPGWVEMAEGGTLFLDEIAEVDPGVQAKLLQVLQDGSFSRVGGDKESRVDARVICATHRQLWQEIKSGRFREDLFYRISVISIELPRLQERRGDIPMLIAYFLRRYCEAHGCEVAPPSNSLLKRLQDYRWPGNIRELQNVVRRYVILRSERAISESLEANQDDSPTAEVPSNGIINLKKATRKATQQLERTIILKVLDANRWHLRAAAKSLCISYSGLLYKMRQLGLGEEGVDEAAMDMDKILEQRGRSAQPYHF
jgi:two-component system response regulator AtoC